MLSFIYSRGLTFREGRLYLQLLYEHEFYISYKDLISIALHAYSQPNSKYTLI